MSFVFQAISQKFRESIWQWHSQIVKSPDTYAGLFSDSQWDSNKKWKIHNNTTQQKPLNTHEFFSLHIYKYVFLCVKSQTNFVQTHNRTYSTFRNSIIIKEHFRNKTIKMFKKHSDRQLHSHTVKSSDCLTLMRADCQTVKLSCYFTSPTVFYLPLTLSDCRSFV